MGLPVPLTHGYPPPGVGHGSVSDVYDLYVSKAPNQAFREQLFALLNAELGFMSQFLGHERAWLGGPLISHVPQIPELSLALGIARDEVHLDRVLQAEGVTEGLTVRDAVFSLPFVGVAKVMRPMGGKIDAYLCSPRSLSAWEKIFSKVPDDPTIVRGLVEVWL